jgi:putative DNA primase/helicase
VADALQSAAPLSKTGDSGATGDNPESQGENLVTGTSPPTGSTGDTPILPELAHLPLAEWGHRQWTSRATRPRFVLDRDGVWQEGEDKDGNPTPPEWVCGPLVPAAYTRDADGEAWGLLLVWWDPDGCRHRWAMPAEMLATDGAEYRRVLLNRGLSIASGTRPRNLLTTFLQTAHPDARARNVPKLGWHGGAFVFPDAVIGAGSEELILQTMGEPPKIRQAGTIEQWRANVAALAAGNSRVVLALSAAFAGPLLELVGEDSGGIHFVGGSSVGKTVTARVAVSVWGGPEYMQRWRATSNGLEATAQAHNDALLVLDELAQVEPREAGEVAYMLANGEGKVRSRRDGLAKPKATWRLFFLSTGEVGLADHMRAAGKRAKAGQEVRLADVPADAGAGTGIFEELHGHSAPALAETLRTHAATYYGTPARAFLEALAPLEREPLVDRVRTLTVDFEAEAVPEGADGQVRRVATRFALAAAGGELATAFGLTGWEPGEAMTAAQCCFRDWLGRRGGSQPRENREVLEQVALFLERHGEARFVDLDHPDQRRDVPQRAGFRQTSGEATEYFILPNVWRAEVCEGLDAHRAAAALAERGWLEHDPERHTTTKRIPGEGRKRVIHLKGIPDASA